MAKLTSKIKASTLIEVVVAFVIVNLALALTAGFLLRPRILSYNQLRSEALVLADERFDLLYALDLSDVEEIIDEKDHFVFTAFSRESEFENNLKIIVLRIYHDEKLLFDLKELYDKGPDY
jgi:hypothetical protein